MKSFIKILKYVLPYKGLLIIASIFSILFSLSNGLTVYSVVPLFDTLTDSEKPFTFTISDKEKKLVLAEKLSLYEKVNAVTIKIKENINSFFLSKSKKELLLVISIAIIPLVILRALFDFIARLIFSYAGNKAVFLIRNDIFSHVIKLPYQYFHKSRSGELMSRITTDVIPLTSALTTDVYHFFSGLILLITNILILSIINWKMIILILIVIPFVAFPISIFGNLVKKYTKKIQESFADLSSHLLETFSGIKVIKSFSMENYENKKFNDINNTIFSKELKKRIYQNISPATVEFLGSIAAICIFIYGGYQIINEKITSSEFIFFILIILNLFEPIKNISDAVNGTKAGEAAANRIFKILDYPKENLEIGIEGTFNNSIEFNNVSFNYNNNDVLNDINIIIPKRRTIGIVGASGSGKTTILNLIASFYSPVKGKICFDTINNFNLSLNWIRKNTAIVTQDLFLFHGTVLENITCGQNIEMSKVIDAAKIAHAHEFITALPQGYSTIIGERGALLSGGERQRLSIARAIVADSEIILFDEATSALDSESEKLVQDGLDYLFAKTSVIVSHRLSTIKYADIIYFLENGTIKDTGSHQELLKRSLGYRKLFNC